VRIALLIGYAALGAVAWSRITPLSFIPLISITIALSMGLVFTIVLEMRKFDRLWFNSRTIAETVKKETWLFMMRVRPYDQPVSDEENETNFIDTLREVAGSAPTVIPELSAYHEENTQITDRMRETRKANVLERLKIYAEDRLQDQQRWYARKAKFNLRQASNYTILMWVFQAFTVVFALLNVLVPALSFNLIGIATTTAAAILLWSNTKGYSELYQSYGFIAQELCFYEDKTRYITTENQLSEFVLDVERTMSQERTVWSARRQSNIKSINLRETKPQLTS
jgi:hypothetical protein